MKTQLAILSLFVALASGQIAYSGSQLLSVPAVQQVAVQQVAVQPVASSCGCNSPVYTTVEYSYPAPTPCGCGAPVTYAPTQVYQAVPQVTYTPIAQTSCGCGVPTSCGCGVPTSCGCGSQTVTFAQAPVVNTVLTQAVPQINTVLYV